jgi:hypothetical protein
MLLNDQPLNVPDRLPEKVEAVIVPDAVMVVAPDIAPLTLAVPSKDWPQIVLAVANLVALATLSVFTAFS